MISEGSKNNIIVAVEIAPRIGRVIIKNGIWWKRKKLSSLDIVHANRTHITHTYIYKRADYFWKETFTIFNIAHV